MMIKGNGFIKELELQGIKLPDDIVAINIDMPANGIININYQCHLDEETLSLIIKALNKNHDE